MLRQEADPPTYQRSESISIVFLHIRFIWVIIQGMDCLGKSKSADMEPRARR